MSMNAYRGLSLDEGAKIKCPKSTSLFMFQLMSEEPGQPQRHQPPEAVFPGASDAPLVSEHGGVKLANVAGKDVLSEMR